MLIPHVFPVILSLCMWFYHYICNLLLSGTCSDNNHQFSSIKSQASHDSTYLVVAVVVWTHRKEEAVGVDSGGRPLIEAPATSRVAGAYPCPPTTELQLPALAACLWGTALNCATGTQEWDGGRHLGLEREREKNYIKYWILYLFCTECG